MALAKVGLGSITQVAAGSTSIVYTVGSAKTTYIRSIQLHNLNTEDTNNTEVHIVPNSGGSPGTATSITRIVRVGLSTEDTFFYENSYPITLTSNGDTIQVYNTGSDAVNVLILGDKEG